MTHSEARNILGVGLDASEKEIKSAFRKAAKTAHPDTGGTEEEFVRVQKAKDLLLGGGKGSPFSGEPGFTDWAGFRQQSGNIFDEFFQEAHTKGFWETYRQKSYQSSPRVLRVSVPDAVCGTRNELVEVRAGVEDGQKIRGKDGRVYTVSLEETHTDANRVLWRYKDGTLLAQKTFSLMEFVKADSFVMESIVREQGEGDKRFRTGQKEKFRINIPPDKFPPYREILRNKGQPVFSGSQRAHLFLSVHCQPTEQDYRELRKFFTEAS